MKKVELPQKWNNILQGFNGLVLEAVFLLPYSII